MSNNGKLKVGNWLVDADANSISCGDESRQLRTQVMKLLVYLARHADEIVSPERLLEDLWAGKVVTQHSVYTCINELRGALHEDGDKLQYIKTIPKRGYQLVCDVDVEVELVVAGNKTEIITEDTNGSVPNRDKTPALRVLSPLPGWVKYTAIAALALIAAFWLNTLLRSPPKGEPLTMEPSPAGISPSPQSNSIAVLPFINMSDDESNEYFSDGISVELLNLLARIPELRVISRSSAFSFKNKNIDIPTVAEQLNVAHVLEGSVRKAGNQVRITAQLIEAHSDTHLWSDTFDRTLDDIFAMQDEIAARVVEQLKLTLLGDGTIRVRTTDPEAYALFLQARYIRLQNNPEAYEQAIQLLQQALAIDTDYLPAWEGLAEMYVYQGIVGVRPAMDAARRAREAFERAIAIDPNSGIAVSGLGWIAILYDHDLAASARHFERALRLDPTNLDIIDGAAYLAEALGRLDTAVAFKEYAISRDPAGPVGHFDLGLAYLKVGRTDDAAASMRIALTLHPGHFGAWHVLGLTLLARGEIQAALEAISKEQIEMYRLSGLAFAHHELGQTSESDKFLAELIEKHATVGALEVASVYAWRGDNDNAFAWLVRAREQNETGLANIASHYSFRNLHGDSRWQPFLARLGQSDAQLAAVRFNITPPE